MNVIQSPLSYPTHLFINLIIYILNSDTFGYYTQRQCGVKSLPRVPTDDQCWESNPRPFNQSESVWHLRTKPPAHIFWMLLAEKLLLKNTGSFTTPNYTDDVHKYFTYILTFRICLNYWWKFLKDEKSVVHTITVYPQIALIILKLLWSFEPAVFWCHEFGSLIPLSVPNEWLVF